MVYPGTLFHRRQRGFPMRSYENRSEIRALDADHLGPRAPLALRQRGGQAAELRPEGLRVRDGVRQAGCGGLVFLRCDLYPAWT
jgi:hypothetical protein